MGKTKCRSSSFWSRPPRAHVRNVPSLVRLLLLNVDRVLRHFWHIFELPSLRSIDATPLSLRKVSPLAVFCPVFVDPLRTSLSTRRREKHSFVRQGKI